MPRPGEKGGVALLVLGLLLLLGGMGLLGLFGVSGYFLVTRPVHSHPADAQPVTAFIVGLVFALALMAVGGLLVRRGRR